MMGVPCNGRSSSRIVEVLCGLISDLKRRDTHNLSKNAGLEEVNAVKEGLNFLVQTKLELIKIVKNVCLISIDMLLLM